MLPNIIKIGQPSNNKRKMVKFFETRCRQVIFMMSYRIIILSTVFDTYRRWSRW